VSAAGLASTTTNSFNVTSAPPRIASEAVVITRKKNKKGNPIGSPMLSGYTITFSTAMDQTSLSNSANFQLALKQLKNQRVKVGKKFVTKKVVVLKPIGFRLSNVTSNSVTISLAGKQTFPKGGQIMVNAAAPSGVDDATHVFMAQNGILSIGPTGKSISLVQT
jgi:hypothetical protein